jgi:flagellar basal body-associated protein FliL
MRRYAHGNIHVVWLLSLATLLLLVVGSAAFFLLHKDADEAQVATGAPQAAYVNLGEVVAQIGGGRFIRAGVLLELSAPRYVTVFERERDRAVEDVRRGFGQVSEAAIYTVEGKRAAQAAIVAHLNHDFAGTPVRDVLFSNFLIARD